jgi:hypothetical protein
VHHHNKGASGDKTDWSVFYIGAGTPMPYVFIPANIRILLLQPGYPSNDIVANNIGDSEIDQIALLNAYAIAHAHHI